MKRLFFTLILIFTACLSHAQVLYSPIAGGGAFEDWWGTISKLDIATNTLTGAFSFDYENGAFPFGSLLQASDGKLYGMTYDGGNYGIGVFFSYDPATAVITKLLDFDGINGGFPYGNSLIQASNGKLYGMTSRGGGSSSSGVIFSYEPATAVITKLYDFDGYTNGGSPDGSLMQASNGKLYGMTRQGGSSYNGVIFSYEPATAEYAKLMDFGDSNGRAPSGSLIQASDGKLYGMTNFGGSSILYGVIFSYEPATAVITKLYDFDGYPNGGNPNGSLMQASNGKLYGMTQQGGSWGYGVIFSFDPSTTSYSKLYDFGGTDGAFPNGSLMQASNGKLYGMTNRGGSNDIGVSFSFDPVTGTYTKLADFTGSNGVNPGFGSFIEVCIPTTWYRDADGDGFGDLNNPTTACSSPTPTGYVADSSDCDDTKLLYADNDGDGFGAGSPVACGVANHTDCNDNNAAVHPGAVEICGNGIDDNCDGQVDEGCAVADAQISISDRSIVEGNKGGKLMAFVIQLSKPAKKIVRVNYTTQDITATAGSDYTASSGTLTFLPGVKKLPLPVLVYGDKTPEADETFRVVLSNPVNATIADGTGIGTILNDDGATPSKSIAQNQAAVSAVLKDVKLSPNPANGKVSLTLTGYSGNITIQLMDLNGKLLQERKATGLSKLAQQQIDISNYSNGVYLVTVIDEKGNRKTEKLIIAK